MKFQQLIFSIALCCLIPVLSSAQGLSYGFRVGLNFANMPGELEQDDAGEDIERLKTNTGFHVGASVRYNFTERFGVKGDFLFSQKGTQQFYDGQGAQLVYKIGSTEQAGITGTQDRFLRITNSYIEIPISGFAKFNKIEFYGGPYVGILVSSKAIGEYKFESGSIEIDSDLNYNYFKDDITDPANIEVTPEDYEIFNVGNNDPAYYPNVANAYDDFTSKDGKVFKGIDFGLNAGLAYFLNRGLYVSANINYGLIDISNGAYDHSYANLKEGDPSQYAERDDVDRNVAVQVSVGFAF